MLSVSAVVHCCVVMVSRSVSCWWHSESQSTQSSSSASWTTQRVTFNPLAFTSYPKPRLALNVVLVASDRKWAGGESSVPSSGPPEGAHQLSGPGSAGAGPDQKAAGNPVPTGSTGPGGGSGRRNFQRGRIAEEEAPPPGGAAVEDPGL